MKRRGFLKGVFAVPFAGKAIAETKGTSKSVSEYRGYFVDLSKEQTLDVLKQSELIWYLEQGGPFGPWPKVDIVYDDKRWGIGFTTLADNVGVDISIPIPEWHERQDREALYKYCNFGARLVSEPDSRHFMLVKCYSDG